MSFHSVNFYVNIRPVKRSQPALHLSKTPLIFVLAQVRFDAVADPTAALPAIREAYGALGFPDLATRSFDVVTAAAGGVQRSVRQQWEFLNRDRTQSIIFDEASLVLQTTAYKDGDAFLHRLEEALEVISRACPPSRLLRIGLRYVDLINPLPDHGLAELVHPALRAAAMPLSGEALTHLWESLRQTSATTKLLVRYTEAPKGFAFPPDLGPFISLKLPKQPEQAGPFGLLDTDHFEEKEADFSVGKALAGASELHDVLDQTFRRLVTPLALEQWT